jgi:hypothetical protein
LDDPGQRGVAVRAIGLGAETVNTRQFAAQGNLEDGSAVVGPATGGRTIEDPVGALGKYNVVKVCAGKDTVATMHSTKTACVRFAQFALPNALTIRFIGLPLCARDGFWFPPNAQQLYHLRKREPQDRQLGWTANWAACEAAAGWEPAPHANIK